MKVGEIGLRTVDSRQSTCAIAVCSLLKRGTAVIALYIYIYEEEKTKNTKKRRLWIHDVWKKRKTKGEFATLYKEFIDH
jgi:hypothetical protein